MEHAELKVVVFDDGSMEATIWADDLASKGEARLATAEETNFYNGFFEWCDAAMSHA